MNPSSSTTASSPEALLSRMERVRVLASQLVRQAADHDDLVQEVVARALANPTQLEGDPEPWIRRVLKNLAIDRQRSGARRKANEEMTVDVDAVAQSTADSVARAEKQRDLVNAVLKLKDPYRSVILKRFFDGLPPREIAKVMGVPVATVKKQQERGMALLRKELESRYGDKGSWAVALLPLLPKSALKALSSGGAVWLSARSAAIAIASVAVCAVAWVAVVGPTDPTDKVEPAVLDRVPVSSASKPVDSAPEVASVGEVAPRSKLAPPGSAADVLALPRERMFRGTFVDSSGAPVPGVSAQCRWEDGGALGERTLGSTLGVVEATLEAPADAVMIARVEAQGYAPAEFRFRPDRLRGRGDSSDTLDVGVQTLFAEASLRVRVLNPEGEPLLGWTMSYFYYGGGDRLELDRAESDPITGAAQFEGIAAASVEVGAEHPSGLSLHHPRRRLSADQLNTIDLVHVGPDPGRRVGLELEFPPTAAMAAQEPVELQLYQRGEVIRRRNARVSDRSAAFDDLDPGAYELRVEDPRFDALALAVQAGRSTTATLRGSASLELAVSDRSGKPCSGFSAEMVSADGAAAEPLVCDDASPTRFPGLIPAKGFLLVVTGHDGDRAAIEVPALRPRELRVMHVTLGEGVTGLTATVLRGTDQPVAGADVAFVRGVVPRGSEVEAKVLAQLRTEFKQPVIRLLGRGRTDASGSATLLVPTSELGVAVTAVALSRDHATAKVHRGTVELRLASLGSLNVRLEGAPNGLPAGVALTVDGSPQGEGSQAAFGPGIVLAEGPDGTWSADGVPCGDRVLRLVFSDFNHKGRGTTLGGVTGPVGYPLGVVPIEHASRAEFTADVRAWMPGRVDLEVREAGRPVRDAIVELEPFGSHAGLPEPTTPGAQVSRRIVGLTDGEGHALFPVVPKGIWRVRVRDSHWLWSADLDALTVEPSAAVAKSVRLELAEGSLSLLDQTTGAPLAGLDVWFEPTEGVRVKRQTDEHGRLSLRLGPGSYQLFTSEAAERAAVSLDWGPAGPSDPIVRL